MTIFVCQTCDEHGNPNWPPRQKAVGTATITGEEWEIMRTLLWEIEPRQMSPKRAPWRKLWQLAHDWLRRMEVKP